MIEKNTKASIILFFLLLSGCASTPDSSSIQKFAFNDGELQFERSGCNLFNAKYKNTSTSNKGIVYHRATVTDQNKNTVATFDINCNSTVAGGTASCLVRPLSINNAGFYCSNFNHVLIQR